MKHFFSAYLLALALLLTALPAAAEEPETGRGWGHHGGRWTGDADGPPPPFGAFCPRRHADFYGASHPVRSADEASRRLQQYFNRPASQITLRKELRMGYIVDILNPDGSLSDRVIIDKRTGRIRSIR